MAIGLLEDNCKWINYLTEAYIFAVGAQLWSLFIIALLYGPITELLALWDRFKQFIYKDLLYFLIQQPNIPPAVGDDDNNIHFDYSLYLIHQILADQQKTLIDYCLPQFQRQWGVIAEGNNPLLTAKLQQYDYIEEERQFTKLHQQLNAD